MQQATNAQREPSMEEILASIRRIIEDSDAARKNDPVPPAPQQAQAPVEPAPRPKAPVIDVDAFRAELRGRLETPEPKPVAAPAAPAQETPRPRTLAEVQAEIMRGARPAEPVAVAVPTHTTVAYEREAAPPERVVARIEAAAPVAVAAVPAPAMRAPAPVIAPFGDETVHMAAPAAPPVRAPEPIEPEAEPEPQRDTPRPAIISPRAGRQVAAAFGELSEAFAESRKKSFDEMAEQMLRPMLQDWLDNNLPVLVERLVREEIERVARGA